MIEIGTNASSEFRSSPPETVSRQPAIACADHFASFRSVRQVGLAIALYGILADAALETFLSGAAIGWLVAATVVAYTTATVLLWRRFGWTAKAMASYVVCLLLLLLTAWPDDGLTDGLRLFGRPTAIVLGGISVVAVLVSGAILIRQPRLPRAARAATGVVAFYGLAAFLYGMVKSVAFPNLFHGESIWVPLPFWLQGAFIGTLVLVPVAAVFQIATGLQLHGQRRGLRALQIAGLGGATLLAIVGLWTPVGLGYAPTKTAGRVGIVRLSVITFARGESGSQPVGPATRLQQGTKDVYAFVNFEGLTREDTVDAVWYKGGDRVAEQNVKMAELYGASLPKKGYLRFILQLEQGALPGIYFLEISVDDVLAQVGILPVDAER